MKKYIAPECEMLKLCVADIVTVSFGDTLNLDGQSVTEGTIGWNNLAQ